MRIKHNNVCSRVLLLRSHGKQGLTEVIVYQIRSNDIDALSSLSLGVFIMVVKYFITSAIIIDLGLIVSIIIEVR